VGFAWERKNMSSVQKASLLVGILAIVGGGAFVYFDPLDLNLLGLKQKSAVAQAVAPKHIAVPAAQPPAAAPKAAVPQAQTKATVAVQPPTPSPAPAASSPVAAPKAAVATTQAKTPASATLSPVSAPVAVVPAAPVPVAEQPMKLSKETKTASKPAIDKSTRPKNLDLRHCLDLETDAAIAKCAGE
jgi:hypothetical protein